MAVPARQSKRRPYGTILFLTLLAAGLIWVLLPLSRGEPLPGPLAALERFLPRQAFASEGSEQGTSAPEEGRVRVFVSGRSIAAYNKIVRDDLWNPTKNTWAYSDLDESLVESSGVIVNVQDIVGRVLAHDKSPGYVFTEKDFLPEGTRPGLSAGVPAGKRALRIEVDKVHGIVGLQPGDRFDMVAAISLDGKPTAQPAFSGLYSAVMGRQAELDNYRRAKVKVLVQNGIVVTPLQTRQVPTTSSSLTQGTRVRTIPVQEMVVALAPEEVAPFMEALSIEAEITCLARSGRPDDLMDSVTPSSDPTPSLWSFSSGSAGDPNGMKVIESIQDGERTLIPVPGAPLAEGPR